MIHLIRIRECTSRHPSGLEGRAGDALTSGCDRLRHARAARLVAGELEPGAADAEGDGIDTGLPLRGAGHAHQEPLIAGLPRGAAVAATAAIPAGTAGADGVFVVSILANNAFNLSPMRRFFLWAVVLRRIPADMLFQADANVDSARPSIEHGSQ